MKRTIGAILLIGALALSMGCTPVSGDAAPEASEDNIYGWHCLDQWDGNHDGLEALVRQHLNDPGSMETVSTSTTPVEADTEQHIIFMDFTAKNTFGGRVRHRASGSFDTNTCEATLFGIE